MLALPPCPETLFVIGSWVEVPEFQCVPAKWRSLEGPKILSFSFPVLAPSVSAGTCVLGCLAPAPPNSFFELGHVWNALPFS